MRGKKSSSEEKVLKGTANSTREKQKANEILKATPEVADYLNKTKTMLDLIWKKLNAEDIQNNADQLDKYSKLFILWQKHYFAHCSYVPKAVDGEDAISRLISNKEL